jgi:hypothetical protein
VATLDGAGVDFSVSGSDLVLAWPRGDVLTMAFAGRADVWWSVTFSWAGASTSDETSTTFDLAGSAVLSSFEETNGSDVGGDNLLVEVHSPPQPPPQPVYVPPGYNGPFSVPGQGALVIDKTTAQPGDLYRGSFDYATSWLDADKASHSFASHGEFDVEIQPLPYPGDGGGP